MNEQPTLIEFAKKRVAELDETQRRVALQRIEQDKWSNRQKRDELVQIMFASFAYKPVVVDDTTVDLQGTRLRFIPNTYNSGSFRILSKCTNNPEHEIEERQQDYSHSSHIDAFLRRVAALATGDKNLCFNCTKKDKERIESESMPCVPDVAHERSKTIDDLDAIALIRAGIDRLENDLQYIFEKVGHGH